MRIRREILALAAAWTVLAELAIAALLIAAAVILWAPEEDLPWTPLRLEAPLGLATQMKFEMAAGEPGRCRAVLSAAGVRFQEAPARRVGDCATIDALRLHNPAVALSPPAPVMTCPQALAYVFWTQHAVQPTAQAQLGERVTAIEHYGTYACRNLYGRATGARSQHAYANALDVAAFRTASGRRVRVLQDFDDPDARGRFLRAARDGACPWFGAVLSPDYNAAHRDHFHLDRGPFRACR